jgi:hypothetical protein
LNSATGPSACVHARPCKNVRNLRPPLRILELVVAVGVRDLPRVLVRRDLPLGIPLHARGILHAQMLGQVLDHRPRRIQRILQEEPQITDRAHLQREPQPTVIASPLPDQLPVHVV